MPHNNRARRNSVVDALARVPVNRGSLLNAIESLLKTIETSENAVMIPTLLRDKCEFDAWELLFVAKILKASILGHSDLVEFYLNHMNGGASVASASRVHTPTSREPQTPLSPSLSMSPLSMHTQAHTHMRTSPSQLVDQLALHTQSNGAYSDNADNKPASSKQQRPNSSQDSSPASHSSALSSSSSSSSSSDGLVHTNGEASRTAAAAAGANNSDATSASWTTAASSTAEQTSVADITESSSSSSSSDSAPTDEQSTKAGEAAAATVANAARRIAQPPSLLQLTTTNNHINSHATEQQANNKHKQPTELMLSITTNGTAPIAGDDAQNGFRNTDSSSSGNFLAVGSGPIGGGNNGQNASASSQASGSTLRTSRSANNLSRHFMLGGGGGGSSNGLTSGASSPRTSAMSGCGFPQAETIAKTPVGKLAGDSSAPVRLLLQIEQLKTSIRQVTNLLESVVELYKNSIDNLA